MATDQEQLIREIEEDLRREKTMQVWKRYAKHIIAAAVLVIAAAGGYVAWRNYQQEQVNAESARFYSALDRAGANERDAALASFTAIARDGRPGFAPLARMQEAALKAQAGDLPGAVEIYRSIAADGNLPAELRDLARMMAALNAVSFASAADLERELAPLSGAESRWRHMALEVRAMAALRLGELPRATELLRRIVDDAAAPAGTRRRAAELLQALGGA